MSDWPLTSEVPMRSLKEEEKRIHHATRYGEPMTEIEQVRAIATRKAANGDQDTADFLNVCARMMELAADRDAWKGRYKGMEALCQQQQERAQRAELAARPEAMARNAARYEWMRSNDWDSPIVKLDYDDYANAKGDELDAAVDRAMGLGMNSGG